VLTSSAIKICSYGEISRTELHILFFSINQFEYRRETIRKRRNGVSFNRFLLEANLHPTCGGRGTPLKTFSLSLFKRYFIKITVIRSTVLGPSLEKARTTVYESIDEIVKELRELNRSIHDHPELGYQEVFAHKTLTDFLETQGFRVTRHAYGLKTSFEAEIGSGGRLVMFCAEYDALPGIGHGCGHNLIATSSIAAFIGLVKAKQKLGIPGRVRILGTPAEEGGGGKVKLIEAGAFKDSPSAAIMCHPTVDMYEGNYSGVAGWKLMVSYKMLVEFRGKAAHAANEP
jgi:hypothetical protein